MLILKSNECSKFLDEFAAYQRSKKLLRIEYKYWKMIKELAATTNFVHFEVEHKDIVIVKGFHADGSSNGSFRFTSESFADFCIDYGKKKETKDMGYINNNTGTIAAVSCNDSTVDRRTTNYTNYYSNKGEKTMSVNSNANANNFFKGFDFGPANLPNLLRMSHLGLAIRNKANTFVSYDKNKKELVDVDLFDFNLDGMIYKVPVAIKDIAAGDVVFHNGVPMIVTDTESKLCVVDPVAGEEKVILPARNMFGFNYVTKIVSLFDMSKTDASEDSPFGNMLPLMMMGDSTGGKKNLMMMMMFGGGKLDFSNPMMMMALMGGDNTDNMLPLMLMMNGGKLA